MVEQRSPTQLVHAQVHDQVELVVRVKGLDHRHDVRVLNPAKNLALGLDHLLFALNELLVDDLEGILLASLAVFTPLYDGEVATGGPVTPIGAVRLPRQRSIRSTAPTRRGG